MTNHNDFFNGEPIILQGSVVKREKSTISIQMQPGLIVDVREQDVKSLEEATDPVTGRTFIRVSLSPDGEISTLFQPRLARLALMNTGVTPFSVGGALPVGVVGPTFSSIPPKGILEATIDTIGKIETTSRSIFFGITVDDSYYGPDERPNILDQ